MPNDSRNKNEPLVLVALNEINFDVARAYVNRLDLRNFRRAFDYGVRRTSSEEHYEYLEPWIQWVSAHTGLSADKHGVRRLGDIVDAPIRQVFEILEANGFVVGCVSTMNAANRLREPAYFVPDPWTDTPSDDSLWSRLIGHAIKQAVNDNAQHRVTLKSKLVLAFGLLRFARLRHYREYLRLALNARRAPWRKALFLDLFLHDLHCTLRSAKRPHFSTVFFNAGAHIQHHYFFCAKAGVNAELTNPRWYVADDEDPVAEMLTFYDALLGEYFEMGASLIVATGLTQKPYDRVKFYYRLKDHAAFLRRLGLRFSAVHPRMTRDFLVSFERPEDARRAEEALSELKTVPDGLPVFGDIQNRGDTLFASLTYPEEMRVDLRVRSAGQDEFVLSPHVTFVAIKNGMHDSTGYVFYAGAIEKFAMPEQSHVRGLHKVILDYFGISSDRPSLNDSLYNNVDVQGTLADAP